MSDFKPAGWSTVTPRIIVEDVGGLAQFMKTVFGATGDVQRARPSEMKIGDSLVIVSDGDGARTKMPAFLYVYVEDVDETFRRAVDAHADVIEAPADMPYGDRRATVGDRWGNLWQIATRLSRRA